MKSALKIAQKVALLLSSLTFARPSAAQEVPADIVSPLAKLGELPPAPTAFERREIGAVTWEFHPSAAGLAAQLMPLAGGVFKRLAGELGATVAEDLTIRIARGPRDMQALAPRGAPPPAYAVGVAYPARGLIILSVVAPGTWLPPDMASVLAHELSHVVLHRAVAGHAVPLWFTEGLAVVQAREQNLSRIRTLWEGALAGSIVPISDLARHFPARPHEVNLAYAESADLVAHLMQRPDDQAALPELVRRLATGVSFEQALLSAYRIDLAYLEREWRQSLRERFHVTPLLLSGTVVWGLIAVLAAVAFVRKRRDHHARLAHWAAEEATYERAMRALELRRRASEREELAQREGLPLGAPPRDPALPTVEYDGERFTLH